MRGRAVGSEELRPRADASQADVLLQAVRAAGFAPALALWAATHFMVLGGAAAQEIEVRRGADGLLRLVNQPRTAVRPPRPQTPGSGADVARLIAYHSQRRGLDPRLVRAVIRVESNFDPRARSRQGAMGLMQLMPETARELGVTNVWDPGENIRGGTTYLRRMLDRFGGDLELALAGYNAGPSSVERYGRVPPFRETRNYVRDVLRFYRGRGDASLGGSRRHRRPVLVRRDPERGIVIFTPD